MENYFQSIQLLGLRDQNLPVFKEARYRRINSIEKMNKMLNVLPRLCPKVPLNAFFLNRNDPEWDDKMIYPIVSWSKYATTTILWGLVSMGFAYNWNVIHANPRLRHLKNFYPVFSVVVLGTMAKNYHEEIYKVNLFEDYCAIRAKELFEENKYLLNHEHFKRFVYFHEDYKEVLERIHRQANNHDAADFKDSELILQDFIRRYSDPQNPDPAIFAPNGAIKMYN